jgi:hypothetical protein
MFDLQQRSYYKIFTGSNQIGGHENIFLGYEAKTTELALKKDTTTFFHMPFFARDQTIHQSTLGADGAFPGPIPAMADRIFKKLGNYGNTSTWGELTGVKNGTWLCSWYYAVSSETPVWLDRYYNPGRLAYDEALKGEANFTDYINQDPIYYDVVSQFNLTPQGYYQYFHIGESTISEIISSFSGEDSTRLRLNIDDWQTQTDKSIYNNKIVIDKLQPNWIAVASQLGYEDRYVLSFENSDFINSRVLYSDTYNFQNEFTLSFWVNNSDWSNATSTQLIGNLQKGGYGIFYNNLNYNPFFVVPETTYGHLFYTNQEGNIYFDKNVQYKLGYSASPEFVGINSNSEVVILDTNNTQLVKYNHTGDVIAVSQNVQNQLTTIRGEPIQLLIDGSDSCLVLTTSALYTFDKDLTLVSLDFNAKGKIGEQMTYNMSGTLFRELSCRDIKFDSDNRKWTLREELGKGVLCVNDVPVPTMVDYDCSNIAIDPENNIWVFANPNLTLKLNPKTYEILGNYDIGILKTTTTPRNISFIQYYNRATNTFTWYAYIYISSDKTLYQITLDGRTIKTTFIPPKLNILDPATTLQDRNLLTFNSKGDFTGYDRRRIFNKVLYNNNKQLQLKLSIKKPSLSLPPSIYTLSIPVQYLQNKTWHLITVTFKNLQANLYIDNYLRSSLLLPGNIDLDYRFKNDLIIGCPCGKNDNLNIEINTSSIIWNGYIDAVRIYDYAIEPKFIKYLALEKTIATDIIWNIPTPNIQYIEEIERFFKHRLPGSKSAFFNIKLSGLKITDLQTRARIEKNIISAIERIKPGYTELLRVEWID